MNLWDKEYNRVYKELVRDYLDDGYEIAEAAGNAFEDANFHSWAKVLRDPDSMDTITKGGK